TCLTNVRNAASSVAPANTNDAATPSWRMAALSVVVGPCPWGTRPSSRSPRGARPYRRGPGRGGARPSGAPAPGWGPAGASGAPPRAQPPNVRAALLAGVQDFFFPVRP